MKGKLINKKIVQAMTIGMSAFMALSTPITALADDVEGAGDGDSKPAEAKAETAKSTPVNESVSKKVDEAESKVESTEKAVDGTKDDQKTGNETEINSKLDETDKALGDVESAVNALDQKNAAAEAANKKYNDLTSDDVVSSAEQYLEGVAETQKNNVNSDLTDVTEDAKTLEEKADALEAAAEVLYQNVQAREEAQEKATEDVKAAGAAYDDAVKKESDAKTAVDSAKLLLDQANEDVTAATQAKQDADDAVKAAQDELAKILKDNGLADADQIFTKDSHGNVVMKDGVALEGAAKKAVESVGKALEIAKQEVAEATKKFEDAQAEAKKKSDLYEDAKKNYDQVKANADQAKKEADAAYEDAKTKADETYNAAMTAAEGARTVAFEKANDAYNATVKQAEADKAAADKKADDAYTEAEKQAKAKKDNAYQTAKAAYEQAVSTAAGDKAAAKAAADQALEEANAAADKAYADAMEKATQARDQAKAAAEATKQQECAAADAAKQKEYADAESKYDEAITTARSSRANAKAEALNAYNSTKSDAKQTKADAEAAADKTYSSNEYVQAALGENASDAAKSIYKSQKVLADENASAKSKEAASASIAKEVIKDQALKQADGVTFKTEKKVVDGKEIDVLVATDAQGKNSYYTYETKNLVVVVTGIDESELKHATTTKNYTSKSALDKATEGLKEGVDYEITATEKTYEVEVCDHSHVGANSGVNKNVVSESPKLENAEDVNAWVSQQLDAGNKIYWMDGKEATLGQNGHWYYEGEDVTTIKGANWRKWNLGAYAVTQKTYTSKAAFDEAVKNAGEQVDFDVQKETITSYEVAFSKVSGTETVDEDQVSAKTEGLTEGLEYKSELVAEAIEAIEAKPEQYVKVVNGEEVTVIKASELLDENGKIKAEGYIELDGTIYALGQGTTDSMDAAGKKFANTSDIVYSIDNDGNVVATITADVTTETVVNKNFVLSQKGEQYSKEDLQKMADERLKDKTGYVAGSAVVEEHEYKNCTVYTGAVYTWNTHVLNDNYAKMMSEGSVINNEYIVKKTTDKKGNVTVQAVTLEQTTDKNKIAEIKANPDKYFILQLDAGYQYQETQRFFYAEYKAGKTFHENKPDANGKVTKNKQDIVAKDTVKAEKKTLYSYNIVSYTKAATEKNVEISKTTYKNAAALTHKDAVEGRDAVKAQYKITYFETKRDYTAQTSTIESADYKTNIDNAAEVKKQAYKTADETYDKAVKAAEETRKKAEADAEEAYQKAIKAAADTRDAEKKTAKEKQTEAKAAAETKKNEAKAKADQEYTAAKQTADGAKSAAKSKAEAAKKAAYEKADADYKQAVSDAAAAKQKAEADADQEYKDTVAAAKKTRDDAKEAAKQTLKDKKAEAEKQRVADKEAAKENYNKAVKEATDTRDKTKADAKAQKDSIYAAQDKAVKEAKDAKAAANEALNKANALVSELREKRKTVVNRSHDIQETYNLVVKAIDKLRSLKAIDYASADNLNKLINIRDNIKDDYEEATQKYGDLLDQLEIAKDAYDRAIAVDIDGFKLFIPTRRGHNYGAGETGDVLGVSRPLAETSEDAGQESGEVLGAARTGDESNAVLWSMLTGMAAVTGIGAMIAKKKKEDEE